ncbi:hypothetical protein [Maribacter aquivivus]|uniref:hypothetical protein n=1 Tax=Maribacter aquivivus TaxID=228958 RepID=UPI0024959D47|nr:hypothetical protein [Maribacter aquivivus]
MKIILEKTLKIIRKIILSLGINKKNTQLIDQKGNEASQYIYENLLNNEPFFTSRIGATEFNCLTGWLQSKKGNIKYIDYLTGHLDSYKIDSNIIQQAYDWSGIFPPEKKIIEQFSALTLKDINEIDVLGIWLKENELLKYELKSKIKIPLKDIEPYFHKSPWTKALKGKNVLVIHPFTTSIRSQYKKRELLFEDKNILPEFNLITLRAVQSIAGEKTSYDTWFEALDYMKNEIDKIDFDIAIIGCGAYGLSLGAHIKRKGKKAIHIGGATQILFGIKGSRWDNHPIISKLYNEHWIKPMPEETPKDKDKVEEGCYW